MPTSRPFAYNPGAPISGTTQVGNLAIGFPNGGFGGLEWWNGPDEDLGWVICVPVPSDIQPTPVSGVLASVGFFRSALKTEASFITLSNFIFNKAFVTGDEASTWLTSQGYWPSYPVIYGGEYNCAGDRYTVYSNTGQSIGSRLFFDFDLTSPASTILYSSYGVLPGTFDPIGILTDANGYIISTTELVGGCN
jgi:hypothetical protein